MLRRPRPSDSESSLKSQSTRNEAGPIHATTGRIKTSVVLDEPPEKKDETKMKKRKGKNSASSCAVNDSDLLASGRANFLLHRRLSVRPNLRYQTS